MTKPSQLFLTGGIAWISLSVLLSAIFLPAILWPQLAIASFFYLYGISKNFGLTRLHKKGINTPLVVLAFQGFYFLIALFLVALTMLIIPEQKKTYLPLILLNSLLYLALDLVQMLKQKPNN
ncbi:hypothetical protein [Luteibaculum oceani]|uniref:Uncharacterized protein n=1 Tax=Luteibaculum oceani TaxID=1294296 RepID=A0A5C6VKQ1_9FLAO|nr:hypothetical protein [Luteibaculum oceani]TXC85284.1 hypothetical protein FRX97_01280 [Luteibaculum oceani]